LKAVALPELMLFTNDLLLLPIGEDSH